MATEREDMTQLAKDLDQLRGATVVCSDGQRLGVVKDTQGSYLEIDAPRQRDFWLAAELITLTTREAVTVRFDRDDLDDYKLESPGLEPPEDPFREIVEDRIVSPDEMIEQRFRMERELAEQRQRLPHTHPDGENAPPDTAGDMGTVGEPVESELPRLERQLPEQPLPPHQFAPDQRVASHTGAIVPPADRVPETLNKPITDEPSSVERQTDAPAPMPAAEASHAAREPWRTHEYERSDHGLSEERSGHAIPAAALAVVGATGLIAAFAYIRRRRSHRRRLILR